MSLNNDQLIAVHRNLLINTFEAYSCHFSLILLWEISRQSTRGAWCHQSLDQVSDRVDFDSLLGGYNERLVTIYPSNVRDIFVTRVIYVEHYKMKWHSNSVLSTNWLRVCPLLQSRHLGLGYMKINIFIYMFLMLILHNSYVAIKLRANYNHANERCSEM